MFRKVLSALLSGGADVNARDFRGQTPLHRAAASGQGKAGFFLALTNSACLLNHDCSGVDATDADGWTALHLACFYGQAAVLALLVENGSKAGSWRVRDGRTPLDLAKDHPAVAKYLEGKGRTWLGQG